LIFLIPIVNILMSHIQTRYMLTIGFCILGSAMIYSQQIAPNIDFFHLMVIRMTQSLGIGFLFVPTSVLAYQTVPQRLQGDATALFTMFRNVAGSIGISLSTAAVTTRTQVHMAYLSVHQSTSSAAYESTLSQVTSAIRNLGTVAGGAGQAAATQLYQQLQSQAALLAYMDLFSYCSMLAFAFVPFTFLFSPGRASRGKGGGH
jgi:DHA2 family multidrug resistance protein